MTTSATSERESPWLSVGPQADSPISGPANQSSATTSAMGCGASKQAGRGAQGSADRLHASVEPGSEDHAPEPAPAVPVTSEEVSSALAAVAPPIAQDPATPNAAPEEHVSFVAAAAGQDDAAVPVQVNEDADVAPPVGGLSPFSRKLLEGTASGATASTKNLE